jgi:tetratricopeptide (TPR) repeat protein
MKFRTFIILIISFVLAAPALQAQNNGTYQLATRLMQQQEYADALPLLKDLHQKNPQTYIFAEQLIDCYIQLKEYDKGLEIAQKFEDQKNQNGQILIKKAELLHYKGETEKARDLWFQNLENNTTQLQNYINTARTMVNRREYLDAVEVYKKARTIFKNDRLFFSDIANAYMQAGEYELAIEEWLKLLKASPNQMSYIQRSLLRYNDPLLYDITIMELNDYLDDLSVTAKEYQTFFNLQIWLLQENELYRRALAAAKEYENRSENFNYALFNLGRQLLRNNEFELAEDAFSFYTNRTYGEVRWRSLEELSDVYSRWAKYLEDHDLDFGNQRDSLFQKSARMLEFIESETKSYSGMKDVYLKQTELALDYLYDLDEAANALEKLKSLQNIEDTPELPYLEGRLYLAKKEFSQARIYFTRSNKKAQTGNLSEKTRYFLALTDFYEGDFEFAKIQLKSLGRRNTSYYANDALELRLWLQEGLQADSSGAQLNEFAEAVFQYNNGQITESAERFLAMIDDPQFQSLKDDALLFLVKSNRVHPYLKYTKLDAFLSDRNTTPMREQLMWELAKLAEQLSKNGLNFNCGADASCFHPDTKSDFTDLNLPVRELYEQLILEYPQGFYAPYARKRLTSLNNEHS